MDGTGTLSSCSGSTFLGVARSVFRGSDVSAENDELSPTRQPFSSPGVRPISGFGVQWPDNHFSVSDPFGERHSQVWTPLNKAQELISETPAGSEDYLSPQSGELDSSASPPVTTSRRDYICDVPDCTRKKAFGSNADLMRHKSTVHKEGLDNRTLYVCAAASCRKPGRNSKFWPRKDNFKTHCKTKHCDEDLEDLMERSKDLAALEAFDKSFNDISAVPETPDEARYFVCKEHGVLFKREAELKRHRETVHGAKKLFDCLVPSCSRRRDNAFPRKDHWRGHMNKSHNIQYVTCGYEPECTIAFELSEYHQAYPRHLEIDHQENPPTRPPSLQQYVTGFEIRGYRNYQPQF